MDSALRRANWTQGLDNLRLRRLGLCVNPRTIQNIDGFDTSSFSCYFPAIVLSTIYIMILRKDQLEASLYEETKLIRDGRLKEENPLDLTETFRRLCEACRRGDLKTCQEAITEGANINARDQFDYTPLILASLCGHFEVVQLLLESGALCERDTFQGERCLYNALNDRIRDLLLSYDYSKAADPLQPLASHITSLLVRDHPQTSDIVVISANQSFSLHKFVLSARSPYFQKKLSNAPETTFYKLTAKIPPQAFEIAIKYLYLGEIPNDVGGGPGTGFSEEEILEGIDKLSNQLEIRSLLKGILEGEDRRLARQHRTDEVEKGRNQLEAWFRENVLKHKVIVDTAKANEVKWDRDNSIFADVLLRADEPSEDTETDGHFNGTTTPKTDSADTNGIPVGPSARHLEPHPDHHRTSTLFPVHRAMLIRSDYFQIMFSSGFIEAQDTPHLQIVNMNCSPEVLEVILTYLYTEKSDIPLELAIDVLFIADLLFLEKLKTKASQVISTLGNGSINPPSSGFTANGTAQPQDQEPDAIDIYEVLRAGWDHRVPRLESFAARYFANRLESYIDQPEFADLIRESAARIEKRQETDSIELLDDIRYYLSERFRLRFEDTGIEEMIDENEQGGTDTNGVHDHANSIEDEAANFPSATATPAPAADAQLLTGAVRTLDGEIAGDEFTSDAVNYQLLLGKIDGLLERLRLDA